MISISHIIPNIKIIKHPTFLNMINNIVIRLINNRSPDPVISSNRSIIALLIQHLSQVEVSKEKDFIQSVKYKKLIILSQQVKQINRIILIP